MPCLQVYFLRFSAGLQLHLIITTYSWWPIFYYNRLKVMESTCEVTEASGPLLILIPPFIVIQTPPSSISPTRNATAATLYYYYLVLKPTLNPTSSISHILLSLFHLLLILWLLDLALDHYAF